MRSRQEAAIANLERALERCKKNGVVLHGMDSSLTAYDEATLKEAEEEHGDIYEAMRSLQLSEGERDVQDHGAYGDSGGW